MKLLFIFTGGTIGSTQNGDVISTDAAKSYRIIDAYREKYGITFEYDIAEPYTELSENNTGMHLKILSECILGAVGESYDGIVVTHGTDTLQYSAAAVGYVLGLDTVPVCFVSANAPIERAESNALDNLHGAIRFIEQKGGSGVFVVYRSSDSKRVLVHRSTRLLESRAYSDEVASVKSISYGEMDGEFNFVKNPHFVENNDEISPLSCENLNDTSASVAVISAYPGIRYPEIPSGVRYVIVNTYHSGTVDTKSEHAREFFLKAKQRGIAVFATGIYGGPMYESARSFEELGIIPVKDLSPIAAYVKLWLADSMGKNPSEILNRSLSGDVIRER